MIHDLQIAALSSIYMEKVHLDNVSLKVGAKILAYCVGA